MTVPMYVQPERELGTFTCPQCGALSPQVWRKYYRESRRGAHAEIDYFAVSICTGCEAPLFWFKDRIIEPDIQSAPPPNRDLSEDIRRDYAEAAAIAPRSPRAAAALLRLALRKLCRELGQDGRDLSADIAVLVARGLTRRMLDVLNSVRVVGTDAVGPGTVDDRDDADTVGLLFTILNLIADEMISRPKYLDQAYARLDRRPRPIGEPEDTGPDRP